MNKEINIAIDARMINSSGIGRYLQNILPSILKRFEDVILLGKQSELDEYACYNKDITIIPFDSPIYSIQEQMKYSQLIPKCDVFFSPHYNVPLFPIKAKHRITTIHDVFHLAFYKDLPVSQKLYSKLVTNRALKLSDKIITVSNFSKQEILEHTSHKYSSKINVIHNGVDIIENKENITSLPFSSKSYFTFVGNVKPHKNLKRAIEAYRIFLNNNKDEKIIPDFLIIGKKEGFITGDNNIVEQIENDPILKKYVQFTGWISDSLLNQLYSNALCLIFPSYYEGFGFPPLEAMMLGTPCIVSNTASLPEICNDSVLYFDPFNINDILAKMEQIFNHPTVRIELIEKGYENVKGFAWQNSIDAHIKLFEETFSKRNNKFMNYENSFSS